MHSPKRHDKFETNLKIKRKQKEQKLDLHELLYKKGVGLGASKAALSCARHLLHYLPKNNQTLTELKKEYLIFPENETINFFLQLNFKFI